MKLNFENHAEAQDMIKIIQKEKEMSVVDAIAYSVNDRMYNKIIEEGWASIALGLWGHDEPERQWDKLEYPCVEVEFEESKMKLIEEIVKNEKVEIETAVSYFLLFTMDYLGYHI